MWWERESTLFTNLVSVLVKRESRRGEECNNKKAKQVPAGVEVLRCSYLRERGQVKHSRQPWKVILRVRAQQRIQDWSCTKKRYSARGGIFCSWLALLQNLFRPFGKLTNCVLVAHQRWNQKTWNRFSQFPEDKSQGWALSVCDDKIQISVSASGNVMNRIMIGTRYYLF